MEQFRTMLCTGGRAPLQYNRGAKDVF
ncbi:MAG: hypothetical protein J6H19_06130 [Bacteroidaceae bacterium]|nr:hypothetical protein [Bacteroidaceae bacterium]